MKDSPLQPEADGGVRAQRVVSLGDLYAGSCAICGKRGEWGIANQSGPEGCVEATQTGRIFCLEHLDDQRPAKANVPDQLSGVACSAWLAGVELENKYEQRIIETN